MPALTSQEQAAIFQLTTQEHAEAKQRLLEKANPELRGKITWIENWFHREARKNVRAHYELGSVVKELYDEENHGGSPRYGLGAFRKVCTYFRWGKDTLYAALVFAQEYTSAEIDAICKLRMPDGQPVSYSHLRVLCNVSDPERRQALLTQAVSEGWTSTELAHEVVREVNGPSKSSRRGRPLAVPRDFDAMVRQQMVHARDWARRDERVWSDPGEGFARKAEGVSSEKMTPERMEKLEQLRSVLASLAKRTQERLQEVEAVLEHFRRGQEKQAQRLGEAETVSVPKSTSENKKKPPAKTVLGKAKPVVRSTAWERAEASELQRTMGCRVGDATAGP